MRVVVLGRGRDLVRGWTGWQGGREPPGYAAREGQKRAVLYTCRDGGRVCAVLVARAGPLRFMHGYGLSIHVRFVC